MVSTNIWSAATLSNLLTCISYRKSQSVCFASCFDGGQAVVLDSAALGGAALWFKAIDSGAKD
jgi:hypothetical protein